LLIEPSIRLMTGHVLPALQLLREGSVRCCVTSPPYWGLRSYGTEPQVWDGAPGCRHRWRDGRKRAGNGSTSMVGVTKNTRSATRASHAHQTCRCGAWRGELGLEPTPEMYVEHLVEVFRGVRRALARDGTLWLVIGDSYASDGGRGFGVDSSGLRGAGQLYEGDVERQRVRTAGNRPKAGAGLKPKDLVGIPWRVAFALQADGWWLRDAIIWHKPNPLPESVRDRTTRCHEYLFMLSKNGDRSIVWRARDTGEWSRRPDRAERVQVDGRERPLWRGHDYYFDADAISEPLRSGPSDIKKMRRGNPRLSAKHLGTDDPRLAASAATNVGRRRSVAPRRGSAERKQRADHGGPGADGRNQAFSVPWKEEQALGRRNARSVWTISTVPYRGAHFAVFPPALARRCILAGSAPGDAVLDPFGGSGTTVSECVGLGRHGVYIDLQPSYAEMAAQRVGPLLVDRT
jgi:DNA modification methylase